MDGSFFAEEGRRVKHPAAAAEMSAWYRRDPRAGVAIVCDAVSGLAVVDTFPTCWRISFLL